MKKVFLSLAFLLIFIKLWAYSGGDGSEENPYQIASDSDLKELMATKADWNKNFIQTAEIDLENNPANINPIGDETIKFIGSYDGQGKTIANLTISESSKSYIALFGYLEGAQISNLTLENVAITGQNNVGVLAGWAKQSTIEKAHTTGSVYGASCLGGLVGYNYESEINNSHSKVTIVGSNDCTYLGGLVGFNDNGTITNSCASGDITGSAYIGGLLGESYNGQISNSYAFVNVSGDSRIGGLLGDIVSFSGNTTLSNCYASGNVNGSTYVGGLAGFVDNVIIENSYATGLIVGNQETGGLIGYLANEINIISSYWDKENSGQTNSAGGEGKTTAEMKNIATYENWNFPDTWHIDMVTNDNEGYPSLAWQELIHNPEAVNYPPEISSYSPEVDTLHVLDQEVNFNITAIDQNGDELTYQWFINEQIEEENSPSLTILFASPYQYGWYNVKVRISDGEEQVEHFWTVRYGCIGIEENMPQGTYLYQNYPNPFNPLTTIKFYNARKGIVKLSIYNSQGEEIAQLYNSEMNQGFKEIKFNAGLLNSGIYYYKLETSDKIITQKMIFLK